MRDIVEELFNGDLSATDILNIVCNSQLIDYGKVFNRVPHSNPHLQKLLEACDRTYGIPTRDKVSKEANLWTISDRYRQDIVNKLDKNMTILELGTHYGYTTRFFSEIFNHVVAVDVNPYMLGVNQTLNCDRTNITYVNKDLYSDTWDDLRQYNVDVVFLDAVHKYDCVVGDIANILSLSNVKYILFDDYGSWYDVYKAVNFYIDSGDLIKVSDMGLSNSQLLQIQKCDTIPHASEGILCKINI